MNVGAALVAALQARQADLYPILPNVHELRRQNGKHGASITVNVPDETVKNLRGKDEKRRDLLLFVRIPAAFLRQLESPIVQPPPPPMPAPGVPLIIPGR